MNTTTTEGNIATTVIEHTVDGTPRTLTMRSNLASLKLTGRTIETAIAEAIERDAALVRSWAN